MDDRILLVPPIWSPLPTVIGWQAPAFEALLSELAAGLPLDIFPQPTLKEGPHRFTGFPDYISTLSAAIQPVHHVVEMGGTPGEPILLAVADSPARSVVISGFFPSPKTLVDRGQDMVADAMETVYTLVTQNAAQTLMVVMVDGPQDIIERSLQRIDEEVDRAALRSFGQDAIATRFSPHLQVKVPALYLALHHIFLAAEGLFDLFREYAPNAEQDELLQWGAHMHKPEGGYELAGKAIAFIKRVIAQREAAGQT